MKTRHTPGPWEVMACPIHKGKHPLHDNRYIVTQGTDTVLIDGGTFHTRNGSLICKMRDTQNQARDAALIAAAPDMLEALQTIAEQFADMPNHDKPLWVLDVEAAISKATE